MWSIVLQLPGSLGSVFLRSRNVTSANKTFFTVLYSQSQEDSGNASAEGNYSIQVLSRALETWNLKCMPVLSSEAGEAWRSPLTEKAFICNLDRHWLTLRKSDVTDSKVHFGKSNGWWNFNSMFPAPMPVSEIYLAEFLAQLKDEGYGIFVVRGILPEPKGPGHKPPGRKFATLRDSHAGDFGKWVTPDESLKLNKAAESTKKAGLAQDAASRALARLGKGSTSFTVQNPNGGFADANAEAEDAELRAAINASLGIDGGGGGGSGGGTAYGPGTSYLPNTLDDDLARALAESLGASHGTPSGSLKRNSDEMSAAPLSLADDEDADLARAIAASIGDGRLVDFEMKNSKDEFNVPSVSVPPEPEPDAPGAVDIAVRGEGTRARRRFLESDTVETVEAWVGLVLGLDMRRNQLCMSFPRKTLDDRLLTLTQAGVKDKDALAVAPRR